MTAERLPPVGSLMAGRYRLLSVLGSGGMGVVYRAEDIQLGREVAVKLLRPVATRSDSVARLQREARLGAALDHPGVVSTLDFVRDGDTWFIVSELVHGGDLHELRQRGQMLTTQQIARIGYQIADVLTVAHETGLIHRDLKPSNIFVVSASDLRIKVGDFGLAHRIDPEDPRDGRLTHDGSIVGTPEYLAPEQITGAPPTTRSDIYAFGCLLFDLATGDPPFLGAFGKVMADQLYAPPPSLLAARPDLSRSLDELVQRMLAKLPDARPSAEAVRRRLAALDIDGLDPHARSRDATYASDRRNRMITLPPPVPTAPVPSLQAGVAVSGSPDRSILTALAASGLDVREGPPVDPREAHLMFGASLESVGQAVARGELVIADADRNEFSRISSLLSLGVAEVVLHPLVPANVVRKVQRALRKRSAHD